MYISATIKNNNQENSIIVSTESNKKEINIPAKADGKGSSINGGEFLFLALATCFCNDAYREAARRNINIKSIEVNVAGEFGKEAEPASNIYYEVHIQSDNSDEEINKLIHDVDKIAEIHNTLRKEILVTLKT